MRQIHFFAAGGDLVPVLDAAENAGSLVYVAAGRGLTPQLNTVGRGCELPRLGIADADSAVACASYLVAHTVDDVCVRHEKFHGVDHYFMDQLVNPDTVMITPGGVFNELVVLAGCVATVSNSAGAQDLVKRFQSGFRKHFKKLKTYWVGSEAQSMLAAGRRLTIAVQSPVEFDLKP